ncbi:hypothetical protein Tco_0035080 [Tanacetum coccineum]
MESVRKHFGPSKYKDPQRALLRLLQLRTIEDYQPEFEKLMPRVMDIPNSLLISFYISGHKLYLQRELIVSKPTTLGDTFSLARITEARLDDQAAPMAGTSAKTFGKNGGDDSESSGPVTPTEKVVGSGHSSTLFSLVEHENSRSLQLWERIGVGDVHVLMDNDGSRNFVQPNTGEQMRLQAMVMGRPYQGFDGSPEEITWKWMSDSQSAYSPYHLEGKMIFKGVRNVTP